MKRPLARLGLTAVIVVALAEWVAAANAYRQRIGPQQWDEVRSALEALPPDAAVFLAHPWLGPRARMEIPSLGRAELVGAADLRGHAEFWVLGLDGRRWSEELQDDLEDLPLPRVQDRVELGPLTLTRYAQTAAGHTVSSLSASPGLEIESGSKRCRGRRPWRCESSSVQLGMAEVEYRPRHCLVIDTVDGEAVSLRAPMSTGNVLRGHVGLTDFNARLRSDAPISVTLSADGDVLGRWTVTDEQEWFPFAAAVEPGEHQVELRVQAAVGGTWGSEGYRDRPGRPVCIELRSLEEPTREEPA